MNEITLQAVVTRNDEIVAGKIDDELVAMSIESGKYYTMNVTASRIWELLDAPRTVAELCAVLTAEFKIAPDACEKEVMDFLEQLAVRKIVIISSPG